MTDIKIGGRSLPIEASEHAAIEALLGSADPDRKLILAFDLYVPLALRELGGRIKRSEDNSCWVNERIAEEFGSRPACPRAAEGELLVFETYRSGPACAPCGSVFASLHDATFQPYAAPQVSSTLVFAGFAGGNEYMIRKYGNSYDVDFGVFFNGRFTRRMFGKARKAYSFLDDEGVRIGVNDLEASMGR